MNPNNFQQRIDPSQATDRSSGKASRLWQLGMTNIMSPSMMSSGGTSPEGSVAFAANEGTAGIHHSASTPQMNYRNFEEYPGQSASRYNSGPSIFVTPNDFAVSAADEARDNSSAQYSTARNEMIRQSNISKMTEPNYGSPSRYIGKSPNPRDQPSARAPRPAGLGFRNIGDHSKTDDCAAPKSAPAHVKSFEDRAREENLRQWDPQNFDDRWRKGSDEMPSIPSTTASWQTTSSQSHWDLLQAQLGHVGTPSNDNVQSGTSSVFSAKGLEPASSPSNGDGFENLIRYVANARSDQQRSIIPELEHLMSTMTNFRGNGGRLVSLSRSGRDLARQYMYQEIFDSNDGSSRLSREDPHGLIDVAGEWMTRESLHNEIVYFLEHMLEEMIGSPSPPTGSQPANGTNANGHHDDGSSRHHPTPSASANLGHEGQGSGRSNVEETSTLNSHNLWQGAQGASPVPGFQALHLGEQQGAWHGSGLAATRNLSSQGQLPGQFATAPGPSRAPQSFDSYGQTPIGMLPQQGGGQFPEQFLGAQGILYGPSYPQFAPMGFYPGAPPVHQAGPMLPYGSPYLRMPGPHANFMPLNAFQPQWAPQQPFLMPSQPASWSRPNYLGSVYGSMNGARSPLPKSPDGSLPARSGRTVVPEVTLLPYRPGSDDMYPHGQHGGSIQFQELTRNGGPTYESATRPEMLPFAENARRSKPAEWGVLRIGNIPYTLTKQEVLGFLGRNAKIITPEFGFAIHIIMDRPTGKTMDCFVEFFSPGDAQAALNKCMMRGSQLRLGERVVDVHISSQDELMKELFPRAKNCTWEHGRPRITESTEPYNSGFKSFVTNEELLQMVTWADKPHRSNYTQKCLQRPYECMISTLAKFPWFCVDRYTIKTRDEIFRSTLSLINILVNQLNRANEAYTPHISETLLADLLYAGLNVPAFGEQQRWALRRAGSPVGAKVRMSPLAETWPFEVLGRKAGIDEDVVQKYAQILQSHPANTSKATPFGVWTAFSNEALGLNTLGEIGAHEMEMLLGMLRDVLPGSL